MRWVESRKVYKQLKDTWDVEDRVQHEHSHGGEREAKLKDEVSDLAEEMAAIEGLTSQEVKQYIRYVADRRLIQLGLRGNYNIKENTLEWLTPLIATK